MKRSTTANSQNKNRNSRQTASSNIEQIIRFMDISTAESDNLVNARPVTPTQLARIVHNPKLEPLAANFVIAHIANSEGTDLQKAFLLYRWYINKHGRLGDFWHSLAAMVEQQVDAHLNGEDLVSFSHDRLNDYDELDPFPRYLLTAYSAYYTHLSPYAYSKLGDKKTMQMEIGTYWRWVAQMVRNDMQYIDIIKLDTDRDLPH